MTKSKIRLTIDLTPELDERLAKLASTVGGSKEDAVRDALRVLEALVELHQDGFEFLKRKDGRVDSLPVFVNELQGA